MPTEASPIEILPGLTADMATVFHVMIVAALVTLGGAVVIYRLRKVPGNSQSACEMLLTGLTWAIERAAGQRAAHRHLPLIGTALIFLTCYHGLGALRLDGLTWGRFPRSGLEIGAEPLKEDRDGDGAYDPGDKFDDLNGNGHRDRGVLIPHPSAAAYSVRVDLTVGCLLGIAIFLEALRRGRALVFIYEVVFLRWLTRLAGLYGGICARAGVARGWFLPVILAAIGLLSLFHSHREFFEATGLDLPLAIAGGVIRGVAVASLAAALLGCATGGQGAEAQSPATRET